MAYTILSPQSAGFQPIAVTDTTKNHPLGTRVRAVDPTYGEGEFVYLKGLATTAIGMAVTYLQYTGVTALLAANAIGPVAWAMSANVANQYGWYQVHGTAVGLSAVSNADAGLVFATATGGTIDDAVVAGDRVKLAINASAVNTPATGKILIAIQYPYMDDATAA
jgi:hypothetical protein